MKPAPLKEASLLFGAAAGAALALSSVRAEMLKDPLPKDDHELCIISNGPSKLEPDYCIPTVIGNQIFCNEGNYEGIAEIRLQRREIQSRVTDITPLSGKLFGIRVEKTYAPDLQYHAYGSNRTQCESLQPIVQVKDKNNEARHLPATFKENLVAAAANNSLVVALLGLVMSTLSFIFLRKRHSKKEKEEVSDLQKFSKLKRTMSRIAIQGYRVNVDRDNLQAAKAFLLHLKTEDDEKYYRWKAAIEAKSSGKSRLFQNVESAWKEIFDGWSKAQFAELLTELTAEEEIEAEQVHTDVQLLKNGEKV